MSKNTYLFILCLLFCLFQAAYAHGMTDSLVQYSYRELDRIIYENRRDPAKQSVYLQHYLQRARQEDNTDRLARYYRSFVFYQHEADRLAFIDSSLYYAYQIQDKALIGNVYLTKAAVYHSIKDYQNTLDHYLKAYEYIIQTDDTYSKYRIKNHIGLIKNYLGYYEDAEVLFKECIDYFGQDESTYNMSRGYISSLHGLAWSYTKTNRIKASVELLARALASTEKAGFSELDVHYTIFKQGVNDYFLGEYDTAIDKITQKLPFLYENEDFAWASIGEFYIGKSYWENEDTEKAITIFQKINEVFDTKGYTHPDLREAYELLIDHYKAGGDKDQQLKYIMQLVQVDSLLNQNHKYLINHIHKRYTTNELRQTKRDLEMALYLQKNKTSFIVIGSALLLLLVSLGMYYRQIKTKKEAQALIHKIKMEAMQARAIQPVLEKTPTKPLQLKDEVTAQLLDKLKKFEEKQHFLRPNISLETLAKSFGTNTTYLSNTINTHKKQTVSEYLNTLRIDYMVNEMVNNKDSVLFKYSIESLAEHIGFSSLSTFTRAFRSRTNVTPSAFIKEVMDSHFGAA